MGNNFRHCLPESCNGSDDDGTRRLPERRESDAQTLALLRPLPTPFGDISRERSSETNKSVLERDASLLDDDDLYDSD